MEILERSYITNIKLKGYKSIRDLEIDLFPDFNIIIGKNGSGKTNFLNFSKMARTLNFEDVEFNFSSEIKIFENENTHHLFSRRNNENNLANEILSNFDVIDYYFEYNKFNKKGELIKTQKGLDKLQNDVNLPLLMIKHGIPNEHLYLFERPFNLKISNNVSSEINRASKDKATPVFIRNLLILFKASYYYSKNNKDKIKSDIDNVFNQNIRNNLLSNLTKFTDIENIRLNKDYSVNKIDENTFTVRNLEYEFLVNNKWFPFSSLSDGLKRIFLIIAVVSMDKIAGFSMENKVLLIEEPELGIHPHQFFQLMTFLKEESRNKQIIISTHAPETLDFLDKDELDRIIICKYEGEKGTILKHLTNEEIKDAQNYIDDNILYLSDYWKHADLENDEL